MYIQQNGTAINTTKIIPNHIMDDNDIIISPADNDLIDTTILEAPLIDFTSPYDSISHDDINYITKVDSIEPPKQLEKFHDSPVLFHKMPSNIKSPSANYYSYIQWDGDFQRWKLVRFATPMDGSCLFHAISNSFFEPYHTELLNGKHISKSQMVSHLRQELSQKLGTKISDDPNSPTHYDVLNRGNTSEFSQVVPEFALNYMQDQLKSSFPIGYGYMEFIGNALNKDIYILEAIRRDIYITDELPLTIKGDRRSIILYYMNGHYELVGIHNENGTFDTHFSHEHSLVRFLHNRVRQLELIV